MNDSSFKKKAATAVLATSILLTSCGKGGSKEADTLRDYLEDGNYERAVKYYSKNDDKIKYKNIAGDISAAIDKVYDDYCSGKITSEEAVSTLNLLKEMCEDEEEESINAKLLAIDEIDRSRENFQKGEDEFEYGYYADAIEYYKKVSELDPNYEKAQSRIEECTKERKNAIIKNADEYASSGYYESAIDVIENGLKEFPNDSELKAKLEEYTKERTNEIIKNADEYASNGYYEDAISIIENGLKDFPDDPDLLAKLEEYEDAILDEALEDTYADIDAGQYHQALMKIAELEKDYKDNKKLQDLKKETEDSYLAVILPLIDDYTAAGDYMSAFNIIKNAMEVMPDNADLQSRYDLIEPFAPTLLSELTISESAYFDQLNEMGELYKDSVGNLYNPGNLYQLHLYHGGWSDDEDGYAKVFLNSQYVRLTGTLATADSSEVGSCIIIIYADNDIIYTGTFDRTTVPQDIVLDVTGRQWLDFRITYPDDNTSGYASNIFFANFGVYKQ